MFAVDADGGCYRILFCFLSTIISLLLSLSLGDCLI